MTGLWWFGSGKCQFTKMDFNFVRKEEEYRKINEELELKNKELSEKVEDVMRFQEDFISNLFNKREPADGKSISLLRNEDEGRSRGLLSCYKAKIKSVEVQLEKLQLEIKNKCEELKRFQKNNESLSEEKEKWFLQYNLEKNNNAKLEKEIAACNSKLQLKESDNLVLKKQIEDLRNELKMTSKDLNATENRLKKALEEVEKTRSVLKTVKEESKEHQDLQKRNIQDLTTTVKQIQKHKSELLLGYKKQIQLIDNLKKQKAHIASCKALDIAETDFLKLLDCKLE